MYTSVVSQASAFNCLNNKGWEQKIELGSHLAWHLLGLDDDHDDDEATILVKRECRQEPPFASLQELVVDGGDQHPTIRTAQQAPLDLPCLVGSQEYLATEVLMERLLGADDCSTPDGTFVLILQPVVVALDKLSQIAHENPIFCMSVYFTNLLFIPFLGSVPNHKQ